MLQPMARRAASRELRMACLIGTPPADESQEPRRVRASLPVVLLRITNYAEVRSQNWFKMLDRRHCLFCFSCSPKKEKKKKENYSPRVTKLHDGLGSMVIFIELSTMLFPVHAGYDATTRPPQTIVQVRQQCHPMHPGYCHPMRACTEYICTDAAVQIVITPHNSSVVYTRTQSSFSVAHIVIGRLLPRTTNTNN